MNRRINERLWNDQLGAYCSRLWEVPAVEGAALDPWVSVPMENATQPAMVPDAGPADDPLDPCPRFHGLFVRPLNHRSF